MATAPVGNRSADPTITTLATNIRDRVKNGEYKEAKLIASALSKMGIQNFSKKWLEDSLSLEKDSTNTNDTVSVVAILTPVIIKDSIQIQSELHLELSKAYRIFVDVAWHQNMFGIVFTSTRDTAIANSNSMANFLRATHRNIEAQFEYSCAEQAAKLLVPFKAVWKTYLYDLAQVGGDIGGIAVGLAAPKPKVPISDVVALVKHLMVLIRDIKKNLTKAWYLEVHELRWLSTFIINKETFESIIGSRQEYFKDKGSKHTLCLTVIFIEIIRNIKPSEDIRKLALERLPKLLDLSDNTRFVRLLSSLHKFHRPHNLQQTIEDAIKKRDRYWETRELIVDFAQEIASSKVANFTGEEKQFIKEVKERISSLKEHYEDDESVYKQSIDALNKSKQNQTDPIAIIEKEAEMTQIAWEVLKKVQREQRMRGGHLKIPD